MKSKQISEGNSASMYSTASLSAESATDIPEHATISTNNPQSIANFSLSATDIPEHATISTNNPQSIANFSLSATDIPEQEIISAIFPVTNDFYSVSSIESSMTGLDAVVPVIETEVGKNMHSLELHAQSPNQPEIIYPTRLCKGDSHKRSFQFIWYRSFPWISYKVEEDSIYCFACSKFQAAVDARKSGEFIDKGIQNWKKALEKCKKHSKSANHLRCMVMWAQNKALLARESSVMQQVSSHHKSVVQQNRLYLTKIIETLLFCAQQNIPLRGHIENRNNLMESSDINRGNFLELLAFKCSGDVIFKDQLSQRSKAGKEMWLSPAVQNELIQIIGNQCFNRICKEAQNSLVFSVIMDETEDISRIEQVSIILRYCLDGVVKERFIGFYEVKSTTGESLYQLLSDSIAACGLSINNLVGQSYDGASNMSGQFKGVATRMKEVAPICLYIHCYGHLLNLALVKALSSVSSLKYCMGSVQSLYVFLEGSSKRHAILSDCQKELGQRPTSLKDQSDTRWCCRYVAVKAVVERLESIFSALLLIQVETNPKISSDASSLLHSIGSFEFVFCLFTLEMLLSHTNSFSSYLQSQSIDVAMVKRTSEAVVQTLQNIRNERDFDLIWKKTLRTVENIQNILSDTAIEISSATVPKMRRMPHRFDSGTREITTYESPETFYRVTIFYEAIDSLVGEIQSRFKKNDYEILANLVSTVHEIENDNEEAIQRTATFYGADEMMLKGERKILKECQFVDRPNSSIKLVSWLTQNKVDSLLPIYSRLATTLAVIPVTSCSAERSFSALRRIKTYLRSCMHQERLSSLALCSIERDVANYVILHEVDDIINKFANNVPGRYSHFF
jgi:hypothetical protein